MIRRVGMGLVGLACIGLGLYAAVLHALGYTPSLTPPFRAVVPNESSVDGHGVRVTVRGVRREGGTVRVAYALEHVERRDGESLLVFLHPWNFVFVRLLDSHGGVIWNDVVWQKDFLPRGFRSGVVRLYEAEAAVAAPPDAAFVTVGLNHDLMTNRMPIPPTRP
jgi:hypothetical protein